MKSNRLSVENFETTSFQVKKKLTRTLESALKCTLTGFVVLGTTTVSAMDARTIAMSAEAQQLSPAAKPGQSMTYMLKTDLLHSRLSLVSMLGAHGT